MSNTPLDITPDIAPLGPLAGNYADDDPRYIDEAFEAADATPQEYYAVPVDREDLPYTTRLITRAFTLTQDVPVLALPADLKRRKLVITFPKVEPVAPVVYESTRFYGTVTSPGAVGLVVSAGMPAAGKYQIEAYVHYGATGDVANNVDLLIGATAVNLPQQGGINTIPSKYTVTADLNGAEVIQIRTIGAGAAGSIYYGFLVVTQLDTTTPTEYGEVYVSDTNDFSSFTPYLEATSTPVDLGNHTGPVWVKAVGTDTTRIHLWAVTE